MNPGFISCMGRRMESGVSMLAGHMQGSPMGNQGGLAQMQVGPGHMSHAPGGNALPGQLQAQPPGQPAQLQVPSPSLHPSFCYYFLQGRQPRPMSFDWRICTVQVMQNGDFPSLTLQQETEHILQGDHFVGHIRTHS